jgi:beta-phosphoglucomutase
MSDPLTSWASNPGRAVIFDFNGTLSNDEPVLLAVFADLFAAHLSWSLTEADYWERLAGRSDREIIEIVVAEQAGGDEQLVETMLGERRARYLERVEQRSPIEEETMALVQLLDRHDVPLAIVTGAQRPDVEFVLERRGLADHFAAIVTEEDVVEGKPHPEGFERGAALLGVSPADVLVFEDSLFGVRGAKAAGMWCVGVVGTKTRDELDAEAHLVVDRLTPTLMTAVLDAERGAPR